MNFYELLAKTNDYYRMKEALGWVPAGVIEPKRPNMALVRLERSLRAEINVDKVTLEHARALARDLSILLACPPQYTTTWVFSMMTGRGPAGCNSPGRHVIHAGSIRLLFRVSNNRYSPKDLEVLLEMADEMRSAAESDARRRLSRIMSEV